MIIISLLLLALSPSYSGASSLLLPAPGISPTTYFDWCYKESFECTTDYFVNAIQNKKAIHFNKLVDQVDFTSARFVEHFKNSIIHILNNEDLDLSQLEMLLSLFKKLNSVQPSLLFKMIENELLRTQTIVLTSAEPNKAEFVMIFKKAISVESAQKIKTSILKIPLYFISYAGLPIKSNSASFNRAIKRPLLEGDCDQYKLNIQLQNLVVLKPKSCETKTPSITQNLKEFNFTKEARY